MDYSRLTVIIPTLNEVKDIPVVIRTLKSLYPNISILVSDDGSTDGTKSEVKRIGHYDSHLLLFDRTKLDPHGLTVSVIDAALTVKTKYIIVMDGDGQHPTSLVREMYQSLDYGNDIVVGVRRQVSEWGIYRRILSKGIILIALAVFAIRKKQVVSDMMSGYFGIRTELFQRTVRRSRERFVFEGYKVLIDTLKCVSPSTKIDEIPYDTFQKRTHGKSKLSTEIMIDVLKSLLS